MCIGRHNMTYSYTLLNFKLTVTTQGKDLEVIVNSSMKTSVKWTEAVSKANKTLGCTREILYYHLYYGNVSGHRQLPDSFPLCQTPCEQRAKRHPRAAESNSLWVWPDTNQLRIFLPPSSFAERLATKWGESRTAADCGVQLSWVMPCTNLPGTACHAPKCTHGQELRELCQKVCAY